MYLRDINFIYGLEKYLKPEEFKYCQPVDTWVKQVVLKLGIIKSERASVEEIKIAIIDVCFNKRVSPLLFNMGAWLVGAKSFDLLIEGLK